MRSCLALAIVLTLASCATDTSGAVDDDAPHTVGDSVREVWGSFCRHYEVCGGFPYATVDACVRAYTDATCTDVANDCTAPGPRQSAVELCQADLDTASCDDTAFPVTCRSLFAPPFLFDMPSTGG